MRNNKLKVWSCIVLLLTWSFAGLQGDSRLDAWTTVEAAAQTAPQECKDAAGATIPCPPADDEDRGRTDCQDTDRDGVCDSQEPSECVGQLDELGNGCAADDDTSTRRETSTPVISEIVITKAADNSSYPDPDCNDPDSGVRLLLPAVQKVREAAGRAQTDEGCPDPQPVFDCELGGLFAFCNTFTNVEPEGTTEGCVGGICCTTSADNKGWVCNCKGLLACAALGALCVAAGGTFWDPHETGADRNCSVF